MTKSRIFSQTLAYSLVLVLLWPSVALACDKLFESNQASECVVMKHLERSGVWFELEVANKLRKASLMIPELQLQIEKFEEIEKTRGIESRALRDSVELRRESSDLLKATLEQSIREARMARETSAELRDELSQWYRSVWMWSGLSAVLGGSLAIWLSSS
jgi:hypothetical protein